MSIKPFECPPECPHNQKYGGPHWGDNKCPKCGKKERRYFFGSHDWKMRLCTDCQIEDIKKEYQNIIKEQGR